MNCEQLIKELQKFDAKKEVIITKCVSQKNDGDYFVDYDILSAYQTNETAHISIVEM